MAWLCDVRLSERHYNALVERDAFRAGYSDGFHGRPMNPSDWPNAYTAGYWEGYWEEPDVEEEEG